MRSDETARGPREVRMPVRPRGPFRGLAPALLAGLVGLALTAVATLHARRTVRAEDEGLFQAATGAAHEAIDKRLEAYVALLLSGRGLFNASDVVSRVEFGAWTDSLELEARFPGIQGIGWARVVEPASIDELERRAREEGLPYFSFRPRGDRETLTTILYLEPQDARNQAAMGFDMFSEPVRREAMERARDTGLPAATGRVTLLQEITPAKQAGFLLYVPVYGGDVPPPTVAERHAALRGFVYAPFRAQDLIHGIFGGGRYLAGVDLEVYDGTRPGPASLLYDSNERLDALAATDPDFVRYRTLDVGGRTWTLVFTPRAGAVAVRSWNLPLVVLVSGLAGSLFLFGITFAQTLGRRREREARAAAERAEAEATFLADTSELLASSLDYRETLDRLAQRMVPFLGDLCAVDVVGEDEGIERLATAGGPGLEDAAREARTRFAAGTPAVRRAIATGRPEIVPEPTDEWIDRAFPRAEDRAYFRSLGVGSLVVLPLASRERIHGALTLIARATGAYRRRRLALAEEVARRAAQAIESAWLYRQTQEAVRVRDDFLSIASHELRTPLTSLQAQVQVLRRSVQVRGTDGIEPARLESKLEVVERQVRRLGRLVTDLLDVARIRTGRFEITRERFELRELVEEALGRFGDGQTASQVTVTAAGPAVGNWDRFRLEQVVVNLLGNALKYGAGKPIEARIEPAAGAVRFVVADQGIGIPPEKQDLIFERFARAVSDRHYGGLGLGLYIVREIVQAHGGRIGVRSEYGQGSTFVVELPWDEAGAAQAAADAAAL